MSTTSIFFNQSFDKKKLKTFLYWVLKTFGEKEALIVVEQLKNMGFYNATKAGLSIGLHDLKTPYKKKVLISQAQVTMRKSDQEFQGAEVTATERSQRIVDTWHRTSEDLRKQVVDYFSTYDQLNSVYMMALSGARGNFSQVRQLIGMRGLMADPQGQIISFPIRSNLREGLTLTEYFISCSGARKGLVDTALRTADTGYLTRRLVDISHHIVVKRVTCYTSRGISLKTLRTPQKVLLALKDRLIGRVLAETIYSEHSSGIGLEQRYPESGVQHQNKTVPYRVDKNRNQGRLEKTNYSKHLIEITKKSAADQRKNVLARKNQEISPDLALKISLVIGQSTPQVLVRSPLTCAYTHEVCQLCYGWSMAQGSLVSLGEAVGVIAGQSIGEPGTQLTMRTFHTGGVFSGDLLQEIRAPHSGKIVFPKALQGLLIRTSQGKIAFLIKVLGELVLESSKIDDPTETSRTTRLQLAPSTILFVRQGERVKDQQILAELAITTEEGNQPIKSRQTLFSEIGGRIVQWKSMTARLHRTKGVLKEIKQNEGLLDTVNKSERNYRIDSNKDSLFYQLGSPVLATKKTEIKRKTGIQAYLGPVEVTRNPLYSVLDKANLINQNSVFFTQAFQRATRPNSAQTLFLQGMQQFAERKTQQYEETWGSFNNITLKKIALAKKHGLGSIEPSQALKLGLLSVIATRVGASEKTCTKLVFPNQGAISLADLKTAVSSNTKLVEKQKFEQNFVARNTQSFFCKSACKTKILAPTGFLYAFTHAVAFKQGTYKRPSNLVLERYAFKKTLTKTDTQHFIYLENHITRLRHLNTIAEEGDIVDENYTHV